MLDSYGMEVLADNPLVYYPLNEDSGTTAVDASGNGIDGVIENATYASQGRGGMALSFDGAGDLVRVVENGMNINNDAFDVLATNNVATVEFWTYEHARSSNFAFSNNGSDSTRFIGHAPWSDGTVYFDTGGCCANPAQRIQVGVGNSTLSNWNHWVFIKDGNNKAVYLNNVEIVSTTGATSPIDADATPDTLDTFTFGSLATGGNTFNGIMDDFAVYDTALSAERIAAHYHSAGRTEADSFTVAEGAALNVGGAESLLNNDPFPLVNVARLGTASQSSTRAPGGSAQRAIDGNTDGMFFPNETVTHTNTEANPWWQVDLGASYPIEKLVISNRLEAPERLDNFTVSIYDGDPNSGGTQLFAQSFTSQVPPTNPLEISPPGGPVTGNFVRVQLNETNILSLAEVQVFSPILEVATVQGQPVGPASSDVGATLSVNADGTFTYDQQGIFDSLPAGVNDTDTFDYSRNIPLTDNGTYLGKGAASLLGSDLTDPENDGDPDADVNYNATFFTNDEVGFGGGEFAYNVFDNQVGGGNAKWCCNGPTQAVDGNGLFVGAQLTEAYYLTHFTITSSNDTPGRDPDVWSIQGSNDGTNWDTIYSYNNDGASPWRAAQEGQDTNPAASTTRDQVLLYSSPDGPMNLTGNVANFNTPDTAYSYFRYFVDSNESGGNHALGELEFFGTTSLSPAVEITITGENDVPTANADQAATDEDTTVTIPESALIGNDTDPDAGIAVRTTAVDTNFNDATGFNLVGTATTTGGVLQLTAAAGSQQGSAWTSNLIDLEEGFVANFNFGFPNPSGNGGADGMSFAIQDDSNNILFGEAGPEPQGSDPDDSLTVSFDSWQNGSADPSISSVRVIGSNDQTLFVTDILPLLDLSGQTNVQASIRYVGGALSVLLNGTTVVDKLAVDLSAIGAVNANGEAYVGFGGRTGGAFEEHNVDSFTLTTSQFTGGDTLSVTAIDYTGPSTVMLNGDGSVTYTPAAMFNTLASGDSALDFFTYTVDDGNGGTDTATVTVTINGSNDPLMAVADTANVSEDGPAVNIDPAGNDTDIDTGGAQFTTVNVPQFDAPNGFNLVGSATIIGSTLQLTSNANSQQGSAWTNNRVHVGDGFSADFNFGFPNPVGAGADGMSFAIQKVANNISFGEGGPPASLTISFDSYDNGANDPSISFVSVLAGGTELAESDLLPFDLSGSDNNDANVTLDGGLLSVTLNGNTVISNVPVDLEAIGAVDAGGNAFVGFGARTGGAAEEHNINNFVLRSTQRSDVLLADGIRFDDFTVATGLQLNGMAAVNGTELELAQNQNNQQGSAFLNSRVFVQDGFATSFRFNLDQPGGAGADGMFFAVHNNGAGAGFLGTQSGPDGNSLTIEIDSHDNGAGAGDPSAANIKVRTNTAVGGILATVDLSTAPFNIADLSGTGEHRIEASYDGALLDVSFDGTLIIDDLAVDLSGIGAVDGNGESWVGLGGRTGGLNEISRVLEWNFSTPSTETLPSGAVITRNTDGTIDYDPNGQFESLPVGATAMDSFTYSVTDGNGSTGTATVTITIDGANDAPTANDDTDSVSEDGPAVTVMVLANDTDPDIDGSAPDDMLTVSAIDDTGVMGTVTTNGTTVSYDPAGQFESLPMGGSALETFTYTIEDGSGATSMASVEITINGANDQPVANPVAETTNEDAGTYNLNLLVPTVTSDVDAGDTLTITSVTQNVGASSRDISGSITLAAGVLSFDTDLFNDLAVGESDTLVFNYTVDDNNGQANSTNTSTITFTVEGRNDAPENVDAGGPYMVDEGASLTLTATFTDDDTSDNVNNVHTATWDINGDGNYGDATGFNPTLTWAQLVALVPAINDGPATFDVSVIVDDGTDSTESADVTLTVDNVPPTAAIFGATASDPAPTEGVLGIPIDFTFTATDPSPIDQAANFTFDINWGDGTTDSRNNASPLMLSHSFQNFGTQTIMVTATDRDTGVSTVVEHDIEIVPVAVVNDDLQATGTPGSDTIIFYPSLGGIRVRYNNVFYPLSGGAYSFGGNIIANGEDGADRIVINQGVLIPAVIDGGDGNDYIAGGISDDLITGGDGNDIILAGEGNNYVDGQAGNDRIEGRSGVDVLFGGLGNDRLNGGAGNDIIDGGADSDYLFGGLGDDLLYGALGVDSINGHYGNDVILGGDDADQLFGGEGHDLLFGGAGIDRIRGDGGDDTVAGGTSNLDSDIATALAAMMATLGTDLATASPAVDAALADWINNGDRTAFEPLGDDGSIDDLTGGAGADAFHSAADSIRDNRPGEDVILP